MSKMSYNTNEDDWWNEKKVTTPHLPYIDTTPDMPSPIYMLKWLFVASESVRIEKRFTAEGAHQPHSQMYSSYVCTDGGVEVDGLSLQPSTWHL